MDNDVEILLVEDNANDEMLALHAFKRQKIANKVHVVRDGAEALEYIFCTGAYADRRIENPKLILLDLKLPLVDGIEVLRQIRSDPRTRLDSRGGAHVVERRARHRRDLQAGGQQLHRQACGFRTIQRSRQAPGILLAAAQPPADFREWIVARISSLNL